jgi:hypothetical protein
MATTTFSGPVVSDAGFQTGTSGSTLSLMKQYSVTLSTTNVTTANTADATATCTGVVAGDQLVITPPASWTGDAAIAGAWVSAADEITIRFINATGVTVDAAGVYKVLAIRAA